MKQLAVVDSIRAFFTQSFRRSVPAAVRQRLPVRFYAWQPNWTEDKIRRNFGDELFQAIASALTRSKVTLCSPNYLGPKALVGGSTLGFARPGDFVWGAGLRDGVVPEPVRDLRVFAVRGPLTADALRRKGVTVPATYGDPAILFPRLFPELANVARTTQIGLVPHFREMLEHPVRSWIDGVKTIRADRSYAEVLREIAGCQRVVSSSLHGIICAEVLGIPVEPYLLSGQHAEPGFKFRDYFAATGRDWKPHRDVHHALDGSFSLPPDVTKSTDDLLRAFEAMVASIAAR